MQWTLPLALLFLVPLAAQVEAGSPAVQMEQAAKLQASGDLQGAKALYESMLAQQPSNRTAKAGEADVCQRLALQARAGGDNALALRTLLDAQKLVPENSQLLYDTGVLEDEMQLYWDADKSVSHLQMLPDGNAPNVLYLAARIKMDLGQLALSAEDMRAYLRAKPDDPTAHYGLGRILQLEEHFDQARPEYERSLALQPKQTESQFELGEIALAQGRYQDAIGEYAKTLAGNPRHGGALSGTGIALFRLKQYAQAEECLQKATVAAPNYEPAHYYLGLTLARLGRKAAAQAELAQAAKMAQVQTLKDSQRLHLNQTPSMSSSNARNGATPQ